MSFLRFILFNYTYVCLCVGTCPCVQVPAMNILAWVLGTELGFSACPLQPDLSSLYISQGAMTASNKGKQHFHLTPVPDCSPILLRALS